MELVVDARPNVGYNPLGAIPKSACNFGPEGNTLDILLAHIAADLRGLFYMVHPTHDGLGGPWAEGSEAAALAGNDFDVQRRGAVFLYPGDLDWFANYLKLVRHFHGERPCWLCNCDRDLYPWTDVAENAAWRGTIMSAEAGHSTPVSLNPLFTVPGVSRFTLRIDTMHTCCKGVAGHVNGSTLETLLDQRPGRQSRPDALKLLFNEIRDIYERRGVTNRLTNLRLSMFRNAGEYPILSATAAETRSLVPVLAVLAQRYNSGSAAHCHRQLLLENLATFYDVIERSGFQLSPPDILLLQESVDKVLLHYKWLAVDAVRHGRMVWQKTVKFHFFAHIALDALYLNPRIGWTYQFENFIQKIIRICRASSQGTPSHRIGLSVMHKYRNVLHVRLARQ